MHKSRMEPEESLRLFSERRNCIRPQELHLLSRAYAIRPYGFEKERIFSPHRQDSLKAKLADDRVSEPRQGATRKSFERRKKIAAKHPVATPGG